MATITEKVAKLLNQAENAGTEAEAAVFMAKAQELATIHSIDLAKARHATKSKEKTTPVQRVITMGERKTRGLNTLIELFSGIAAANDITLNVRFNKTAVIAFGFAEDIDVAEALFASLSVQMAHAAAEYKKGGEWKKEEVYKEGHYNKDDDWIPGSYVPISWLTARLDFQEGFATRVGTRLLRAKRDAEEKAIFLDQMNSVTFESDKASAGTELVLVEKREAVREFYNKTSNARRTYNGGRRITSNGAAAAGRDAGDRARLSNSSSLPGARKALV